MNILRISSDLYPTVSGGIGVHVHEMSRIQVQYGHRVTIITSINEGIIPEPIDNYEIIHFNHSLKIFGNSISLIFLIKLIKERKKYDIIHAHSHLFFTTNACAALRTVNPTPLIITTHGLIGQTAPVWLQRIFLRTVGKLTFKAADKIISYTNHEKDELIELGINPGKIAVIHNGIDTAFFIPKYDRVIGNTILWIGRYTPGKGVQYLIDAFTIIVQSYPDAHLLMIGDGPKKEETQKKIQELGLATHITQKTFIHNEDLPAIYQNSDVFVLPSLSEGVPRTILESMACGIPVVCTDLPQLVNLVDGAGLLVPARDPEAIASAIIKIIKNPNFASELGKTGTKRIVEYYSWNDTVKKTLSLYEEVLCQNSA